MCTRRCPQITRKQILPHWHSDKGRQVSTWWEYHADLEVACAWVVLARSPRQAQRPALPSVRLQGAQGAWPATWSFL